MKTRKRRSNSTAAQLRARRAFAKAAKRRVRIKARRVKVMATNPRRRNPGLPDDLVSLRKLRTEANKTLNKFTAEWRKLLIDLEKEGNSQRGLSGEALSASQARYRNLNLQFKQVSDFKERATNTFEAIEEKIEQVKSGRRATNTTIIKAKKVKVMATNPRRQRNPVALPALTSSLKQQYDPGKLRQLRDRLRTNIQNYGMLTRKLSQQLKAEKDTGRAQDLRRQLGEIKRLESREVSQLDQVLTMIGASKGVFRKAKRNPGVTRKSRSTRKLFTGMKSKKTLSLLGPNKTPRSIAILGKLVKIKTRSKTFTPPRKRGRNPEGDIYLAADDRGHLHIVGESLPILPGGARDLGEITDLEYATKKRHLGYDSTTEFFHELGEEGGRKPHLVTDSEGHLKIVGGDYYIESDGIHD